MQPCASSSARRPRFCAPSMALPPGRQKAAPPPTLPAWRRICSAAQLLSCKVCPAARGVWRAESMPRSAVTITVGPDGDA